MRVEGDAESHPERLKPGVIVLYSNAITDVEFARGRGRPNFWRLKVDAIEA